MSKPRDTPRPPHGGDVRLSRAAAARLSLYLRRLETLLREGTTRVSSGLVGALLGFSDAQVRKDLASLGNLGHPGVGYEAPELVHAIRRALGIDRPWNAVLVGVGNLARALLRYQGFTERGFHIQALFDAQPVLIGQTVEGRPVHDPAEMAMVIAATKADLGILTVPSEAAQSVADALIAAGVRGILNFAPGVLRLPSGVAHVSVDLTVQLEQLAFLVQHREED